jgi:O-antigen/teichoic acid export membrane protein
MNINKRMIHYSISIISLKGVSLLMLPIITSYLSTSIYGELNFLVSLISMLSIFLTFGLSELIFRFTPELEEGRQEHFISECLILSCFISISFFILSCLFANFWISLLPIEVSKFNFLVLMSNLSISLILTVFFVNLRLKEKSFEYMILSLIQGISQASMTFIFLNNDLGLKGVLISGLIATSIITVYFVIKNFRMFFYKNKEFNKIHLNYGFKIAVSSLFIYALGGAENWFIVSEFGKEKLAFYFIASQFALALSLMFEPYRMWWYPIRFKYYFSSPDKAARGAVMGCCLICILASFMINFSPYLIYSILPKNYHLSINYIPILSILLIIKTYAELLNLGSYLDENASSILRINGISALVSIIGISIGIHYFGMNGIFLGLFIAHILRFLMFYKSSQKMTYLNYDKYPIVIMFVLVLIQCLTYQNNIFINTFFLLIMCIYFFYEFIFKNNNIKGVVNEY